MELPLRRGCMASSTRSARSADSLIEQMKAGRVSLSASLHAPTMAPFERRKRVLQWSNPVPATNILAKAPGLPARGFRAFRVCEMARTNRKTALICNDVASATAKRLFARSTRVISRLTVQRLGAVRLARECGSASSTLRKKRKVRMSRVASQDLRTWLGAVINGATSRQTSDARSRVSAASASRWRKPVVYPRGATLLHAACHLDPALIFIKRSFVSALCKLP